MSGRKKKFGHQLLKDPMRVWFACGILGFVHTAIPYVIRGITGTLCDIILHLSGAVERDASMKNFNMKSCHLVDE